MRPCLSLCFRHVRVRIEQCQVSLAGYRQQTKAYCRDQTAARQCVLLSWPCPYGLHACACSMTGQPAAADPHTMLCMMFSWPACALEHRTYAKHACLSACQKPGLRFRRHQACPTEQSMSGAAADRAYLTLVSHERSHERFYELHQGNTQSQTLIGSTCRRRPKQAGLPPKKQAGGAHGASSGQQEACSPERCAYTAMELLVTKHYRQELCGVTC